jgi:mono/diheme cytochrome c family protein
MSRKILIAGATGLVVAAVAAAVAAWPHQPGAMPGDAADALQVARGRQVYAEACASCHGANLQGEAAWQTRKPSGALPAPPHDATGHTWHHSDRQLFDIVKGGVAPLAPPGYVTDMPGFADTLSDAEIWAVLAYIKSRWPESERAVQAERSR